MERIPTLTEAQTLYKRMEQAGLDSYSLTSIERIIIQCSPRSTFLTWLFRQQLTKILNDGVIGPATDKRFQKFLKRWAKGKALDVSILLCDAIIEWKRAKKGGS